MIVQWVLTYVLLHIQTYTVGGPTQFNFCGLTLLWPVSYRRSGCRLNHCAYEGRTCVFGLNMKHLHKLARKMPRYLETWLFTHWHGLDSFSRMLFVSLSVFMFATTSPPTSTTPVRATIRTMIVINIIIVVVAAVVLGRLILCWRCSWQNNGLVLSWPEPSSSTFLF